MRRWRACTAHPNPSNNASFLGEVILNIGKLQNFVDTKINQVFKIKAGASIQVQSLSMQRKGLGNTTYHGQSYDS